MTSFLMCWWSRIFSWCSKASPDISMFVFWLRRLILFQRSSWARLSVPRLIKKEPTEECNVELSHSNRNKLSWLKKSRLQFLILKSFAKSKLSGRAPSSLPNSLNFSLCFSLFIIDAEKPTNADFGDNWKCAFVNLFRGKLSSNLHGFKTLKLLSQHDGRVGAFYG